MKKNIARVEKKYFPLYTDFLHCKHIYLWHVNSLSRIASIRSGLLDIEEVEPFYGFTNQRGFPGLFRPKKEKAVLFDR
ncbi:MAG: hypothetical protein ACUZ8E_11725 [Candidatus Anammoxibacter sp.]